VQIMNSTQRGLCALLLGCALAIVGSAHAEEAVPSAQGNELLSRIDFGNSYVMGQTIQSGAVYLLNRKQSEIDSMLRTRTDFRQEIREDAEVIDAKRP